MEGKIPVSLAIFFLSCYTFASAFEDHSGQHGRDIDVDLDLDKRPYEFGKKPYHYMTEYKRLPLYNFGLGKRSPRYDFGLGKRYIEEEDTQNEYDEYPIPDEEDLAEGELYLDDDLQIPEKRQKLYPSDMGKRLPKYDFGLGKRGGPYDFGLGKRTQRFNFGLGKRNGLYSFGLGKKAGPDAGALSNRFSFGLGKRDMDTEMEATRNYVAKRETHAKDAEESKAADGHSSASKDSHTMDKRSKNNVYGSSGFSRRFRKPLSYNFGLGKRIPLYDFGLGKRNYHYDEGNLF